MASFITKVYQEVISPVSSFIGEVMDVVTEQVEWAIVVISKNVVIISKYVSDAISDVLSTLFGNGKRSRKSVVKDDQYTQLRAKVADKFPIMTKLFDTQRPVIRWFLPCYISGKELVRIISVKKDFHDIVFSYGE